MRIVSKGRTAPDEATLVAYLLGALPPAETERLDETAIVDDEIAARLRSAENDLVDAYVRRELSGDTLRRFESWYLATPRRREQVAVARRFVTLVDRAAASAAPAPAMRLGGPRLWRITAVAAMLAVACTAALLQTARSTRDTTIADSRQPSDSAAHETRLPTPPLEPAAPARSAGRARAAAANAPADAIVLLPQTRDAGVVVPTVRVPPQAARVAFELRLDEAAGAAGASYRVGLRDPRVNRLVWRSKAVAARGSSLTIAVPAGLLKPQHYTLDLLTSAPGDDEVVGSYAFEIVSR